jgi:hypothetical protein
MSDENVEIIRRGFETMQRDGWQTLLSLIDPEFELTTPPDLAMRPGCRRMPDGA